MRDANYVFRATIDKAGASNVSAVPGSERTAIATVEVVFEGAQNHGDFTRRAITILMPAGRPAKQGESLLVFGRVLAYGESLVVEAVEVFEPQSDAASVPDQVKATVAANGDEALRARLQRAELVLLGTVTTEPAPVSKGPELPASEHDPMWSIVQVRPEQQMKGTGEAVSVLTATSDDIRWFRAPKLKQGTRGIFILRAQEGQGLPARGYVLIDPEDLRPVEELDRVKRLLEK